MTVILTIIFIGILLVAMFPLKNWLVVRRLKKKEKVWMDWLKAKPNLQEYCQLHQQDQATPKCDFCNAARQLPSLEMVMTNDIQFGIIENKFNKYLYFKTYICSGCGSELYRKSYVE